MNQRVLELDLGEREISSDILNFMDKCFKWDHNDRASVEELLSHPFIRREEEIKLIKPHKLSISFDTEMDYS